MTQALFELYKERDRAYTWDLPTEETARLSQKFSYGTFETEAVTIPYRLFAMGGASGLPLVIYLHGAGEIGDDNEKPFEHDCAVEFAREEWLKENPCNVLVPQCPPGFVWSMPAVLQALKQLIDKTVAEVRADISRIYLYGCSMGCMGGCAFIKENPRFLAGALLICGATSGEGLENLLDTPIWLFHAKDDGSVFAGYMTPPIFLKNSLGSAVLYEELKGAGHNDIHYTEYPEGLIQEKYGVKAHCAWLPVFEGNEAMKWLFSCKRI